MPFALANKAVGNEIERERFSRGIDDRAMSAGGICPRRVSFSFSLIFFSLFTETSVEVAGPREPRSRCRIRQGDAKKTPFELDRFLN